MIGLFSSKLSLITTGDFPLLVKVRGNVTFLPGTVWGNWIILSNETLERGTSAWRLTSCEKDSCPITFIWLWQSSSCEHWKLVRTVLDGNAQWESWGNSMTDIILDVKLGVVGLEDSQFLGFLGHVLGMNDNGVIAAYLDITKENFSLGNVDQAWMKGVPISSLTNLELVRILFIGSLSILGSYK